MKGSESTQLQKLLRSTSCGLPHRGYSIKRGGYTSTISRNLLALLAKDVQRKIHRWLIPTLLHYLYGALYTALRLNPCSLKRTLRDFLAGLKLSRYGAPKPIGVERLLGYLVELSSDSCRNVDVVNFSKHLGTFPFPGIQTFKLFIFFNTRPALRRV